MTEYRASFDAVINFSNGGDLEQKEHEEGHRITGRGRRPRADGSSNSAT